MSKGEKIIYIIIKVHFMTMYYINKNLIDLNNLLISVAFKEFCRVYLLMKMHVKLLAWAMKKIDYCRCTTLQFLSCGKF